MRYTQYIHPLFLCVPSFNFLGLTIPGRSATKFLMFENWRERKKEELNKQQQSDSGIHNTSTHCSHVISSNLLGLTVPEKSVTKNFNV